MPSNERIQTRDGSIWLADTKKNVQTPSSYKQQNTVCFSRMRIFAIFKRQGSLALGHAADLETDAWNFN